VVAAELRIEPRHLPARLREDVPAEAAQTAVSIPPPSPPRTASVETEELNLERLERRAIERALERTRGNLAEAGRPCVGKGATTPSTPPRSEAAPRGSPGTGRR
jgi:DNA-binding NtrC family response regulator